jgi:hypothetical protein
MQADIVDWEENMNKRVILIGAISMIVAGVGCLHFNHEPGFIAAYTAVGFGLFWIWLAIK